MPFCLGLVAPATEQTGDIAQWERGRVQWESPRSASKDRQLTSRGYERQAPSKNSPAAMPGTTKTTKVPVQLTEFLPAAEEKNENLDGSGPRQDSKPLV